MNEEIYLSKAKLVDTSEVRETKLNVYETVFNIAIVDYIDELQCLPSFQVFWEQVWGGMITFRIISTLKQFTFLTSMLQEVTDLLYKSHLLGAQKPYD